MNTDNDLLVGNDPHGWFRLSWLCCGVCSFCCSSPRARRRSAITRDGEYRGAGNRLRVRVVVLDSGAGVTRRLQNTAHG